MFEEEYPSPGLHSLTEHYSLLQLSAMGIFSTWAFGGAAIWVVGYLTCLGILTPILVEGHRRHGHFDIEHPLRRYCLSLLPVVYTLGVFIAGYFMRSVNILNIDGLRFLTLNESSKLLPTDLTLGHAWLQPLYISSIYMAAMGIVFVALTTSYIRRLLMIFSLNAAVLAIFGLIQLLSGTDTIYWFMHSDSTIFSAFTHKEHFSAFALIWSIAFLGLIFHMRRQSESANFIERWGLLLFAAWAALASSVIVIGTAFYQGLLGLGVGWCILTEGVYSISGQKKTGSILGIIFGLLLALSGIGYALYSIVNGQSVGTVPWEIQSALWKESWGFFLERPLFGCGIDSTPALFALKGSSGLPALVRSPHSDFLQLLVEQGIIGSLIWLAPLAYMAAKFIFNPTKRLLSAHLWVAVILGCILGIVSFPFKNPPFLLSIWILACAAYGWSLVQVKVGQKLESRLVFDHEEMGRVKKLDKPRGRTKSRLESRQWFE